MMTVDPYNYFNISHVINSSVKEQVSNKLNYRLWKMIQYRQKPTENILLGDSRMILLQSDQIKNQTDLDYYNFAYGGGSLEEIIETFWYADSVAKLSSVYIGMNFHLFNAYHQVNEVAKIRNYLDNPFLYLVDRVVIKAGLLCVLDQLGVYKPEIEKPDMTEDQFWDFQLNTTAVGQFERYKYPDSNYLKLKEIVNYCQVNEIDVRFIIFPEHVDLMHKYFQLGLEDEFLKFKTDIMTLAPTYDYDVESILTKTRSNFSDPYHFSDEISHYLIDDIW
ncbi:MAG: hypothetical protein ABIJ45_07660 [Candidatus Zixiibacteriota bacterium]